MTFNVEKLNSGGGMNLGSGVFTAPKAGIYAFSFKGSGNGKNESPYFRGYAQVSLERNGANVAYGDTHINDGTITDALVTVSIQATLKLNKGDQITIVFTKGGVYDDYRYGTHFTGSLVEEELVIS